LGLLINRKNRTVYCYRSNAEVKTVENPDAVSCEPELPGFALQMAKIW
jgi:Uma2 family endonuclease